MRAPSEWKHALHRCAFGQGFPDACTRGMYSTINPPPPRYSSEPGNPSTGGRQMKTGTKAVAIVAAVLAGAAIANAQGRGQWQQGPQGSPQFQGQPQGCPLCGNPHFRPQRQGFQQPGPRNQCNPQLQQQGPWNQANPNFRQQATRRQQEFKKWKPTPKQRERIKQRHQKRLERFDLDGDGKISEQEREAAREVWEEHLQKNAEQADTQPEAPAEEE